MTEPTIEKRLQRRFIVMTTDPEMQRRLLETTPQGWEMAVVDDVEDLGDWHEALLYRFLLLDLDEVEAFDPLDVIRVLRMQYQINLPVFCFGGDEELRDEMRLARADRFFGREEVLERLPQFLEQYGWGG
ncbi:MAG TPA: hypothetical protein VKA14_06010 [Gammaproteobacteria bacterium]|nr:hypothetical protein [Gammaproteobacteria bacterium]